jgi:hypothetical protein
VQRILREEGVPHAVAIGRGEIDAGPQKPEPPTARGKKGSEATAVPAARAETGLSDAQAQELRLAMEELTAARQLLAGVAE